MDFIGTLNAVLDKHSGILDNPARKEMIDIAINNRESLVTANGALATWTPAESSGRSPKDTLIVDRDEIRDTIDWDAPNNLPVDVETFEMLWQDALDVLATKDQLIITDRVVGAESSYALPTRVVTDRANIAIFTDNMFRPVPDDIGTSIYADTPFTIIELPYDRIDHTKYKGRLRDLPNGEASHMCIIADFEQRVGLVYGSAYCGSCKKLMFTVMNYYLPADGILPIHCSANEGTEGDSALLLGLSGTGKTTLSADAARALLGDDEHGWNERGIANFEGGCYAKLVNLRIDKEPEIWDAAFREADIYDHGALIENCMMNPQGYFDVDDERLTANSRVSYPLASLKNIKTPPVAGHPKTILFLTADANGVLPPVAKLDKAQAMLWFLMGYTSKLAGTETGVTEPVAAFSRFFGAPFMPRNPDDYSDLLGQKLDEHGTEVYLVNTGWSGGPYGVGERMDILLTKRICNAALSGELKDVECETDEFFKVAVPKEVPGVPSEVLFPVNTWDDKDAYRERAEKLVAEFGAAFDKNYGNKGLDAEIVAACPGK